MAESEPASASPDDVDVKPTVVDALNEVYRPALRAFEQFHRQEHRFSQKYRYRKLKKRYTKLVCSAHDWRHVLLDRIERLGGEADSTIDGVVVVDDIKGAYGATHDLLDRIYDAVDRAVAAAVVDEDHPTHKLLLRLQSEVDRRRFKVEAWQRQVADLGENYLLAVIN